MAAASATFDDDALTFDIGAHVVLNTEDQRKFRAFHAAFYAAKEDDADAQRSRGATIGLALCLGYVGACPLAAGVSINPAWTDWSDPATYAWIFAAPVIWIGLSGIAAAILDCATFLWRLFR